MSRTFHDRIGDWRPPSSNRLDLVAFPTARSARPQVTLSVRQTDTREEPTVGPG